MPSIRGVEFREEALPFVEPLVAFVEGLLDQSTSLYAVMGEASRPEIRAAIHPPTHGKGGKAQGVFFRLANTGVSAVLRRPRRFTSGASHRDISEGALEAAKEDILQWYELAKNAHGARVEVARSQRNPAWTRDELILALDLYFRVPPWTVNGQHPSVTELSLTLNALAAVEQKDPFRYRNPNGVYMKLMNLQFRDPNRGGRGLKGGGQLETEVWNDYSHDVPNLAEVAAGIRAEIARANRQDLKLNELSDGIEEAVEGKVLTRNHVFRERDRRIVARKKEQVFAISGKLSCEICNFDFFTHYGEHGRGFIECHHSVPLADLAHTGETKLKDLVLLCANCHRMIHRDKRWLRVDELQQLRVSALTNGIAP